MYGRGALYAGRRRVGRRTGQHTRENVGMSSERQVRILSAENLRIPEEGSSAQGKSGPKPRAKAVGDGQLVEIPVPPRVARVKWGHRRIGRACEWKSMCKRQGSEDRENRRHNSEALSGGKRSTGSC